MRGIKIGSVFAVCGFLLSFLSGLTSHTSILSVLIKAFCFAIVFGILGFAIDLVYTKFLAGESSGDFGGDSGSNESKNIGKQTNSNGHLVDITIEDEDLENSGSDNHFVINDNHQMLNESDLEKKAGSENNVSDNSNGFVPLKNLETLKSLSGKEAINPESAVVSSENVKPVVSSKDDELGVLPDMNNLSFENDSGSSSDDEDVQTDEEFVSSANVHKHNDEPTEIKDASLMAKAISSILSDEES